MNIIICYNIDKHSDSEVTAVMFYIAICDDEKVFLDSTRHILYSIFYELGEDVVINCFDSIAKLKADGQRYNLLILDIMLGDDNGIEFAERLREKGFETDIIFITSSPEFALAGYSVYPVDYILKPVNEKKLRETISRCLKKRQSVPALLINSKELGKVKVSADEIAYCEVMRTDIAVHRINGSDITLVGTFSDFCARLPKKDFYRCHRSYVVNMKYVERIDRYSFTLQNGDTVPIAKNSYNDAKKYFVDYINPAEDFF